MKDTPKYPKILVQRLFFRGESSKLCAYFTKLCLKRMLQSLRDQSGKWFIKVLFVAIALSFVIWGIGDVIQGFRANRPVAKVGGAVVTIDNYLSSLQSATAHIQASVKAKLTGIQLKQMGLQGRVVEDLVNQLLVERELKRLHLSISDHTVRSVVHSMPAFHREGRFDKEMFTQILRSNHVSESKFLEDIKQNLMSQQLMGSLLDQAKLPEKYVQQLLDTVYRNHVFAYVLIPTKSMKFTGKPSLEDLKLHYDQHRQKFALPEIRSSTLVYVDLKKLSQNIEIPEDEIKAEFDKRHEEFATPERRLVQKITVRTQKVAENVLSKLSSGRPVKAILRDVGGHEFEEQMLEKADVPEDVREKVFTMNTGENSGVMARPTGFTIYVLSKIEAAKVETLTDTRPRLIEDLRLSRIGDAAKELKNKIEDAVAAGRKLADIASEHKLKVESYHDFDKNGLSTQGKAVLPESIKAPLRKIILEQTFALSEGQESPMTDMDASTAVIVGTDRVQAARIPDFEDVRAKIEEDFVFEKKRKMASDLALKFEESGKTLEALTKLAHENNLKLSMGNQITQMSFELAANDVETPQAQKVRDLVTVLGNEALSRVFTSENGKVSVAQSPDGYVVMLPQKSENGSYSEEEKKHFVKSISGLYDRDMAQLFLSALRAHIRVEINQALIDEITRHDD